MKAVSVTKFFLQLLYFIEITEVQNPVYSTVLLIQSEVDHTQLYSISAFCSICYTFHGKKFAIMCVLESEKLNLFQRILIGMQ